MENTRNQQPSDEVSMGQVFGKLFEIFGNAWQSLIVGLANFRRTSIHNWKFLTVITIVGGTAGYIYGDYIKPKFYESSMILNSEHLNKRILDNAISKLNLLTGEPGKIGLKRALKIDDSLANNIMKFEGTPFMEEKDIIELGLLKEQLKNSKLELENPKIIDEVVKRIEIENRHSFELKVFLYNPEQFKELENALIDYLRNSPYVKKRIEFNRQNLVSRQSQLMKDLGKLDSLKTAINMSYESMAKQRDGSNNIVLKDDAVSGSVDVYKQSFVLYDLIDDVNEVVFLKSDFEVVDGFTELNVPASATLKQIIQISSLIGLATGYLIIGLIRLNRRLEKIA